MLCHGQDARWTDEIPLEWLANQDVPTAANGYFVLSCDPAGFAVIDPNCQLLGMRATMSEVLAFIGMGK
jgi:hypothetical protein